MTKWWLHDDAAVATRWRQPDDVWRAGEILREVMTAEAWRDQAFETGLAVT